MKRLGYLVMLMVLSSSAQAGNTFSFVVGGHRVNIDAPRNCRFASCVSLSIPGIYQTHRKRDRDDDTGVAPTPAKQPAPVVAPTQVAPVVTSVKPAATPVCAPPAPQPRSPVSPTLAATTTQPAPAPPPRPEPDKTASTRHASGRKNARRRSPNRKASGREAAGRDAAARREAGNRRRAGRHQGFAADRIRPPTRRSATGRPKARPGRFVSSNAAKRYAATSSISRQTSRKTSGRTSKRTSKRTFGQASRAMPC